MHEFVERLAFEKVIDDICRLNWENLAEEELVGVAWVYYYFSTQFGESLEIARKLHPDDEPAPPSRVMNSRRLIALYAMFVAG